MSKRVSILSLSGAHFWATVLLSTALNVCQAQNGDSAKAPHFSGRWLKRVESNAARLNRELSTQGTGYLEKMAKLERGVQGRLAMVDPAGAKELFAGSAGQYSALGQQLQSEKGCPGQGFSGAYPAYLDSLKGVMAYLREHPECMPPLHGSEPRLVSASAELQAVQGKMNDAEAARAFLQQRQQVLGQYLSKHPAMANILRNPVAKMQRSIYYYGQQLRQYKEMWASPDRLEREALALLDKVPAFQSFMKQNSMLGGLFHLPSSYSTPQAVSGLQTKDEVAALVHGQVAAGGAGGDAALQGSLQAAQSQLDDYKSKLTKMGTGNGDMNMPDFNPNDQKTKTFWKRIEYGANFQTTRNNYYFPMVTDFGFSLGYKLGHNNLIGLGASYKLGWGNGIRHIAFTSEGVGVRSFLQIRIKGSFSATGGFEYNYTTPFTAYQQLKQIAYWTKSGLIGVTKTISMKSTVFKKTTLSLLWDFLSYQQAPRTEPILFRIGYNF